ALGIADGAAEWPFGVAKHRLSVHRPHLLADGEIGFPGTALAEGERGPQAVEIEAAPGQPCFAGAEIVQVHDVRDAVQSFALQDAAEELLAGGPAVRGIESPGAEHGADGLDGFAPGELVEGDLALEAGEEDGDFLLQGGACGRYAHATGGDGRQADAGELDGHWGDLAGRGFGHEGESRQVRASLKAGSGGKGEGWTG